MEPEKQKLRILLVEDEAMVAMMICDMVADSGHEISSVEPDEERALKAIATQSPDLAILDVNLGGKPSYAVAEALANRGIPFLFSTGYGIRGLEPEYAHIPMLQKPFTQEDLEKALDAAYRGSRESCEP